MTWKRKQVARQGKARERMSTYNRGQIHSVALRKHVKSDDPPESLDSHNETPSKPWTRWTAKRRQTLEQTIDSLLIYTELAERAKVPRNLYVSDSVTPKSFPEAEALLVDELPETNIDEAGYFGDVTPNDLPAKFDISSVTIKPWEWLGEENQCVLMSRLRSRPISYARGHRVISPFVAELKQCLLSIDAGEYWGVSTLVNWTGRKWIPVGSNDDKSILSSAVNRESAGKFVFADDPEQDEWNAQMLMGIAFTRDVLWRVVIKGISGASFSLPTGYKGAMAAFRNREPEETTGRRAALRHWVREHYRTVAEDEEDEKRVHVRQHLRGRTPFRWLGLDCELVVSPFDERRNRLIAERKAALKK